MNLRFPWMVLLVVTGLIGLDANDMGSCDGIFQAMPGYGLTVTPMKFDKDLRVKIIKPIALKEPRIELFLNLNRDEDCNGSGDISSEFTISDLEDKKECKVKFTWNTSSKTIVTEIDKDKGAPKINLQSDADGAYPVKVDVQKEGNKFKMVVSHPEAVPFHSVDIKDCWHDDNDKLQFKLTFKKPSSTSNKGAECGIQLEMKGDYQLEEALIDDKKCDIGTTHETPATGSSVEPTATGSSAESTTSGPTDEPTTTGPSAEPTTTGPPAETTTSGPSGEPTTTGPSAESTASGPPAETTTSGSSEPSKAWIIALVIVIVLVLLVITGVAVYFIWLRKSAAPEDVEEGKSQKEGDGSTDDANGAGAQNGPEAENTQPGSEKTSDKTQQD